MINTIGETAGAIYSALEKNDEMTLAKLKTAIKGNTFVTDAAVGWLAREDKINVISSGRSVKVSLK